MGNSYRQSSFAAGEVGPNLYARQESPQYQQGLKTCRNFIVDRYGSLQRRVGTEFVAALPDPSWTGGESYAPFRLIPFRYQNTADLNSDQNYVLVFSTAGNLYVYRDKVLKDTVALPTGWNSAKVIWGLRYAQAGDTIVFASGLPGTATQQLKRTSDTSWAFSDYVMHASAAAAATLGSFAENTAGSTYGVADAVPVPADGQNVVGQEYVYYGSSVSALGVESAVKPVTPTDNPITISAATPGRFMIDWTDATNPATSKVRIYKGFPGVAGLIGTVDAGTLVFYDTGQDIDYSERPRWEDAANETVMYNAAAVAVAFYKQRLLWGSIVHTGGVYEEMRILASALGEFDNFELGWTPFNETDPVDFTPAATDYQRIQHLVPLRFLVALTDSGEWSIQGVNPNVGGITTEQHSKVGSSFLTPALIDNTIVFVQRQQTQIYALNYFDGADGLVPKDLTWSARHLTDGLTIQDITFQRIDDSVIWMPRSDGGLLGLTHLPDYGVMGWHRHDTGGYSYANATTGTTGPSFDSVCTIPESGYDTTYVIVRRQDVDSNDVPRTRWMLERFPRQIKGNDDRLYYHADSWKVYDYRNTGSDTMTLTGGSTWLAGEAGLTLTDSGAGFVAGDVGDHVWFDPDGSAGVGPLKMLITAVAGGGGSATVTLVSDIPAAYQATASTDWGYARTAHTGYHLGNETSLSILGDGKPEAIGSATTVDGDFTTTLHHSVVVVGITITAQVEQLQVPEGRAYMKNVANAEVEVDDIILPATANSGITKGEDLSHLTTIGRETDDADNRIEMRVQSRSRKGGPFALQCVDAIPLTIRGITRWNTVQGGK